IAFEVVAPGVVDAGQIVSMAAPFQTHQIAAMGAAVNHRVDLAVLRARNDDRRLAEKGRQVVARLRQLAGERQILPGRAEKDPAELCLIDLGVAEHPVRHARIAFGRPFELLLHRGPPSGGLKYPWSARTERVYTSSRSSDTGLRAATLKRP